MQQDKAGIPDEAPCVQWPRMEAARATTVFACQVGLSLLLVCLDYFLYCHFLNLLLLVFQCVGISNIFTLVIVIGFDHV